MEPTEVKAPQSSRRRIRRSAHGLRNSLRSEAGGNNQARRGLRIAVLTALAMLAASTSASASQPQRRAVQQSPDSPQVALFQTDTAVQYRVQFKGAWTTASLAQGVSIPSGAHFTTLVGASHGSGVTFWQRGGTATTGIEAVAELGITGSFSGEVTAAVNANTARQWIRVPGGGTTFTSTGFFNVSESFPLVTLISMVAPSPDWFVGVSGLSLRESGAWVDRTEIDLFPYDAGTEEGSEFSLNNTATSPQETITSIRNTGKFSDQPLGQFIFERWAPVLSVDDARVDAGGTISFRVNLDRRGITPAQQVTVQYATSDGTAAAGVDYTAASGTLTFASGESTKTVTVPTAADSDSDDEDFTLTLSSPVNALLTDAEATATITASSNGAPAFASSAASRDIAEASPANRDIGAPVTATDPDNDALTYALGGTNASSFAIDSSTGQLRTRSSLDFESRRSYSVTVTATDPGGASDTITVTVNVTNVDEPGTITLSSGMPAAGTALTASLQDPDGSISSTTWAWHSSTNQSSWTAISGATSAGYTPQSSDVGRYLRATASYSDAEGSGKSARAVSSNRVASTSTPNRAPDFGATTAGRSVAENTAAGVSIGAALTASDADGDTLTHTLGGTHASSFAIDAATGQLRTRSSLDFESRRSYSVTVTATDPGGASDTITVTVNVTNVDEPGTVTRSAAPPMVGAALAASLTDPDAGVTSTAWSWQRSRDRSTWTAITGATSRSYTPRTADIGLYLRAAASYSDAEGSGKSAQASWPDRVMAAATSTQPRSGGGGSTIPSGGGGRPPPSRGGGSPQPPPQPAPQQFSSAFIDLMMAVTHTEAVEALEEAGLLEGTECAPELFCPNEPILRWVMAMWLVRLIDSADADPQGTPRFADVASDSQAAPFIERLAELEITLGCQTEPELRFCPDEPVTRAQMASFIVRALDLPAPQDPVEFADVEADSVHAAHVAALHAAGITAGCQTEPELLYCPKRDTTRGQMASFVNRARQTLDP